MKKRVFGDYKNAKGFNLASRSQRAKFDSRDAKVLRAVINSNPDLLCKLSINTGPEGHIRKLIIGKIKTHPKSGVQCPGYTVSAVAVSRRSYCRSSGRWLFVLKQKWDSFLRRSSGSQCSQDESCSLLQPAVLTWLRYTWPEELQQGWGALLGEKANGRECTFTPSAAASSDSAAVGRAAWRTEKVTLTQRSSHGLSFGLTMPFLQGLSAALQWRDSRHAHHVFPPTTRFWRKPTFSY